MMKNKAKKQAVKEIKKILNKEKPSDVEIEKLKVLQSEK